MRQATEAPPGAPRAARVIYGAISGGGLVVSLDPHPPRPAVMGGTLLATAAAVGLAELYSEVVGAETRNRRRVEREQLGEMLDDVGAVAFGIAFPAVFFVLAAASVL